jgi:dihydrofolate synthase/folylpolyglutamate synthase
LEYASAIKWLYSTQLFGIKLGLDTIRRLLEALSLAEVKARVLHIAGTNGKGSTAAMLDAICRASGRRTGLFTSPHLVSFCERIRVDGALIPEIEAAARLAEIRALIADWQPHPTFFEIATALGLWWFRDAKVEVIVLETGLGGRLDATNAVTPAVSVITPIAFDHMQWLGSSLVEIAAEKAGIIKPGVPVVSARQAPEALDVIRRVANENGSSVVVVEEPWTRSPVALAGSHQRCNAALAVATLEAVGICPDFATTARGLADVAWPGRFQRIGNRVIIDGAHNPHGARALVETWREVYGNEKATIIFGSVAHKNHAAMVDTLGAIAEWWVFTTVNSPRAVPATELAASTPGAHTTNSLRDALALATSPTDPAHPRRVLICGSLFLAGEALSLLQSTRPFEPSRQ